VIRIGVLIPHAAIGPEAELPAAFEVSGYGRLFPTGPGF
jgi:hypothetical protein